MRNWQKMVRAFGGEQQILTWCLVAILAGLVGAVWLDSLHESFELDETLTAFVARHGQDHPSLRAAPGVRVLPPNPLSAILAKRR